MVGVELVDSAELAELKSAKSPEPEAVDEAELDDALSRMIADLEQSLELAAVKKDDGWLKMAPMWSKTATTGQNHKRHCGPVALAARHLA